jgi:carbonic anhydrase
MVDLKPAVALELLRAGNARFAAGKPRSEPFGPRLAQLADGQKCFAIVLGCSDSRVPIEIVFDQAPGNLFVVRVAGNFLNVEAFGSIEFAVNALKAKLIVVLGHENCGAVAAAVEYVRDGSAQPGHIQELIDAIAPAAREARSCTGDWYENAILQNVARNVTAMTACSQIIAEAVGRGDVKVIGGIYNVHTGFVSFS